MLYDEKDLKKREIERPKISDSLQGGKGQGKWK